MTLPDDVVELAAKAMFGVDSSWHGYTWEGLPEVALQLFRRNARAALEAARYGELVEGLRKIADRPGPGYDRWDNLINEDEYMAEIARALLSTIGEQP